MSQSQIDLEAFRNFEKAAHDKLAESYHDAFSAVTNRAIEPLLKAAHVGKRDPAARCCNWTRNAGCQGSGTRRARDWYRYRTGNGCPRAHSSSASGLSRRQRRGFAIRAIIVRLLSSAVSVSAISPGRSAFSPSLHGYWFRKVVWRSPGGMALAKIG